MENMESSFKSTMNGAAMNGKPNGHALVPRRATASRGSGLFARSLNTVARILTWYTIVTILFRCPSTPDQCDESSARICKPYFQVKHAVAPHLTPYYDVYAAPYVNIVRPYYNTVDNAIITPTRTYATKYGAPRIAQAQAYSQAQWQKNVQPQLVKYQALARDRYGETIAPHVDQLSGAVAPYYDIARTSALQTYHEIILPSYEFVQPYAAEGSAVLVAFTADRAVPAAYWAWNKTYVFLDDTVWPQLRVIYVNTVEPQLVRIGQRLGRYNGHEKEKMATPNNVSASQTNKPGGASSFTRPSKSVKAVPQSSNSATSSIVATESVEAPVTASATVESKTSVVAAPAASESESEVRRIARETVTEDLEQWQGKFATAADEGAAEIEDRVDEIAKRMVRRQARSMGKSLVSQLQDTVEAEVETLKQEIVKIVGSQGSAQSKEDEVAQAVRKAGLAVKEKAVDIRNWRENYEVEMQAAVTKASESHFKILNGIRDLALQKIGMKWAWMDGVTYKDWAKYHAMRDRFDEWTADLEKLIVTHPELLKAQDAAAEVEEDGMEIAQTTAKELARLKQVGLWKVIAADGSENFDSDSTQAAAQAAEPAAAAAVPVGGPVAAEPLDDVVEGSSEPESNPLESAASEIENATSEAEPSPTASESIASGLCESVSSVMGKATDAVVDGVSVVKAEAAAATAIILDAPAAVEKTSEVEVEEKDEEDIIASSIEESPVPIDTASIKPAFLGAAAQAVPSRQPILDEDTDIPASISSAALAASSAAQEAYSSAVSKASERYSAAQSIVSAQIYGTPKPTHEEVLSSVSSVYSAAIAAASSRLNDGYDAASKGIYGTPTARSIPTLVDWAKVEAIAATRLSEGRAWAEEQLENAKIAVGLATPAPSSSYEKLLEQAQFNYYAGIGAAHARYSDFLAAASSAFSSLTATPTPTNIAGTASSIASVVSASAVNAANAAAASASSAANVAAESAASVASAVGENASSVASSAGGSIVEAWEVIVSQVSLQVYGVPTPTPWYNSLFSAAGDYAATAQSGAADTLSGATEAAAAYAARASAEAADTLSGATEAAAAYAASASAKAAKQYDAVSLLINELINGKEATYSESVISRLSALYATSGASASSFLSAASSTAASVVSEATEAVKDRVQSVKDEL